MSTVDAVASASPPQLPLSGVTVAGCSEDASYTYPTFHVTSPTSQYILISSTVSGSFNINSPSFYYSAMPGSLPPSLPATCGGLRSALPQLTPPITNPNPFYLKVMTGNICTCQGCKVSLRCTDSSFPCGVPIPQLLALCTIFALHGPSGGSIMTPHLETS